MKPPIIGQKVNDDAIDALIDALETIADDQADFYVGYPVATTADTPITLPALLISEKFGLVCFDVVPSALVADLAKLKSQQRSIVLALKAKLLQHPDLSSDFDLAFKVNIVTYALTSEQSTELTSAKIVDTEGLADALATFDPFPMEFLPPLNAAIERVANIRPKSKRAIAKSPTSKGSILKQIEHKIANLDSWQKAAAIETPDGPQRIRGLAGSGKTIVLALKAAYLHGERSEWKIGVTFHTRSLKQQLKALIRRFYFDDYRQDPDKSNLLIMHSFGSLGETGIYAEICKAYGITPRDFGYAKRTYGYGGAFQGICAELLREVEKNPKELFDALLIDEAQDMPHEFLRLAYLCTKDHRIVWAYDDLQNLGDFQMRSLRETFGEDAAGNALVTLANLPKQPRQDVILPKCYRNTPWALVTAHALGSGTYRDSKIMVQHPDDPALWKDIGYEIVSGELAIGQSVVLKRSESATPHFFIELLKPEDSVQFHDFDDERELFSAVARMIKANISEDELYPHDIAVIFPNALNAEKRGLAFRQYLFDEGIDSHLVGVTSSRDTFLAEDKVAVSGPYRAKGNEAPMIYVMDAEYCASGSELIKKRNILFTAITRSRGWVRICGCGDGMTTLLGEFEKLRDKGYTLDFNIPTKEEMKRMRTLYRDITRDDRRKATDLKNALEKLPNDAEEASAVLQALPKKLRDKIRSSLNELED